MLGEIMEKQMINELNKYCKEVNKLYKSGNIESSYNKPMIDLISSFGCLAHDFSGERSGKTGENIDIKLWHLEEDITKIPPFGAIEVKKIGGEDERARKQILIETERYGNVILTDNVTWKFFNKDKKLYNGFKLLKKNDKNEFELDESRIELFVSSIKDFILSVPNYIKSSNKLAYYMAEYAKTIKTIVYNILEADSSKPMYNELYALFSKLKQDLLPELTTQAFSDMYAQTIVYGLFIARYNDKNLQTFSRGEAIENLAKESSLLKNFFQHIATSNKLHPTLDETIDKLCYIFSITDLKQLLDKEETKDVIVHFYEDFLSFYDAEQRKSFGAYYTPVQVVRFIINMVEKALVEDFKIDGGLSNNDTISIKVKSDPYKDKKTIKYEKVIDVPKVAILDPACGTGTFGAEIIRFVKDKYFSGSDAIFYKEWLQQENGLMSRLISFEIMMTSYVIAHLKIRRVITETLGNQHLDIDLPSNIFLTNTLAEPKSVLERNAQITFFDFSGAITDEAENADKWKARRPIQVIIGNPPYLYSSKNFFDISNYYYETDGKTKLQERNPKGLNDDYVKFINFSEKHIQKDGKGILAFITNNGYLDNPTFRGMRASLLRTFDKIYILNLHGNSLKKEQALDGSKDENVFDIRIGVSIIVGIKTTNKSELGKVFYSEIYGTRELKFDILENKEIEFKQVDLEKEKLLFIPQTTKGKDEYEKGISLSDLFNLTTSGVDTGNDESTTTLLRTQIEQKIKNIQDTINDEDIIKIIGKLSYGQSIDRIKADVNSNNGLITEYAYRPFDTRWTYYSGMSCGWLSRPRDPVIMTSLLDNNYAIVYQKQCNNDWRDVFVSSDIVDSHFIGGKTYVAPLFIYNNGLLDEQVVNFRQEQLQILTHNLSKKPTPIQVFDYCYGVLNDLNYRKKYNEFLKRDYPKVPIIENQEMFEKYANAGEKLRKLHLMETPIQKELGIESDNNNLVIEQVKYQNGKVLINKNTAITGFTDEIWNFFIGGYQVLDKYLKSHKGENLDREKFNHIKKVSGIIEETIKIQKEL